MLGGFGESVTVLRRVSGKDIHGDPIGNDASHIIDDVLIQWDSTNEYSEYRETSRISGTFYMPIGSDILASDQVELYEGEIVQVQGKPMPWRLEGWEPGVVVRFRKVGN